MSNQTMIEFIDVSKRYGEKEAVTNLSFRVNSGEICVLIGASGCGKTTSLRMINRLIDRSGGEILVDGRSIDDHTPETLRRGIGYAIQNVGLLPHMHVTDNISIVPRLLKWSKKDRAKRSDELLELVGLDPGDYRHKYPRQLSGGEAQRIGVARALAADPDILLMDEPFGAVDPLRRETLQTEFLSLQSRLRKTVIFVTHDLDEAIRLADRILLMRDGTLWQYDSPENILAHPVDSFVRDFLGEDRALKRLSCFSVEEYMRPATTISKQQLVEESSFALRKKINGNTPWITDSDNRLLGLGQWNQDSMNLVEFDHAKLGIGSKATLKEALSCILGHGLLSLPVVNQHNNIIGEIRLKEIEKVNQSIML